MLKKYYWFFVFGKVRVRDFKDIFELGDNSRLFYFGEEVGF